MKRFLSLIVLLLVSVNLVSCAEMNNQDVGTVTGGVAGALIGSTVGGGTGKLVAVAAGALAGAYIGGAIGKNMDRNDRMRMNHALEANSVGQPAYWHNNRTGAEYQVTPVRNVTVDGNQYCREYRTTANIAGRKQQMFGTACRQPDGTWKSVS